LSVDRKGRPRGGSGSGPSEAIRSDKARRRVSESTVTVVGRDLCFLAVRRGSALATGRGPGDCIVAAAARRPTLSLIGIKPTAIAAGRATKLKMRTRRARLARRAESRPALVIALLPSLPVNSFAAAL